MRWAARATAVALAVLGLAVQTEANQLTLTVEPTSTLDATLDAIDIETVPVTPSGSIDVLVTLTQHPSHGRVVSSLQILSGDLALADGDFALNFDSEISLSALSTAVTLDASSAVLSAVATGLNTSTIDLGGAQIVGDGGTLSASGTALGDPVNENIDLATDALAGTLLAGTTLTAVVTENPEQTWVTLTLPVAIQVLALDDPLIVPLTLSGTVSLSGATEIAVPATTGPGLGILLAGMLVGAAWLRRAASGRRSSLHIRRAGGTP